MALRRWLLSGSAICGLIGGVCLSLALACIFRVIGGQCELWLLGPFVAWPMALGLGLIGRAVGRGAAEQVLDDERERE